MDNEQKNESMNETAYFSGTAGSGFHLHPKSKISQQVQSQKTSPKKIPNWNQSSSTWRHTSYRYSVPKAKRFNKIKQVSLVYDPELKSTKVEKTCSLGKGKKEPISEIILRNAK